MGELEEKLGKFDTLMRAQATFKAMEEEFVSSVMEAWFGDLKKGSE